MVSPANQYTADERQQKCWDLYLDSIRKGTKNAYQAAIDSGYTHSSAKDITTAGWFLERLEGLKRKELISKSEKKFVETLDYVPVDVDTGKIDSALLRIQNDVAKHITSTLGKDLGYTTKTEAEVKTKPDEFTSAKLDAVTEDLAALREKYEKEMRELLTKE